MTESTSATPLSRHPVVTGIVGFCAGLVIAYGIGLWQRSSALSTQAEANAAVVAAKDAEIAASAERLAEAQRAATAAESRNALSKARLAIFQALNDLDQRNFGVAGDRLRDAAAQLDAVDAASLGLDPALLSTLKAEIAGTQVLVATDFEQQRLQLLELAARIDAQTAAAGAAAP
ncbi:hypothetical protein [Silanimonas sp.]|jgi:hypothetical protein|uniref:hypothetical protein n=1 Tax=Silanimonas sp. TaxID=1929290 RepID=UPI0022BCC350|nr:hypothetical protein [Silanimonas sp.]MCZ8165303.1 hypothetical protein [Silanimonas sp.]